MQNVAKKVLTRCARSAILTERTGQGARGGAVEAEPGWYPEARQEGGLREWVNGWCAKECEKSFTNGEEST